VALVVPLLVAVAWALARGRPRALGVCASRPGPLVYFAIVAPWLILVETRNPATCTTPSSAKISKE